jgi:hypothetical protein
MAIILKLVLNGIDSTDSGQSTVAGCSECGNEFLCCMSSGEFHDQLSDYELSKDVS